MEAREILEAAGRLARAGLIYKTPLVRCEPLSARLGLDIYQKLELFQATGSFKLRGATNKLLTLTGEERQRGVVTASAGNHALGSVGGKSRGVTALPGKIDTEGRKLRSRRALRPPVRTG